LSDLLAAVEADAPAHENPPAFATFFSARAPFALKAQRLGYMKIFKIYIWEYAVGVRITLVILETIGSNAYRC
jgi:hypothetical protein